MKILKDIGLFLIGLLLGSTVNMLLVEVGMKMVPAPGGFDMSTEMGLKSAMSMMSFEHFIFPFLAHALGTLSGVIIVSRFANHKRVLSYCIGGAFLSGGISMVYMVGGPLWFIILDLTIAYIPMAWLGHRVSAGN
jgi:hypothetical protein